MSISKATISITADGNDGAATGAGSVKVTGKVLSIYPKYPANAPATTRISITQSSDPAKSILTVDDENQSRWYHPRQKADTEGGEKMTYDGDYSVAVPVEMAGTLTAQVSDTNAGAFTITILYEA
jgi:hypothetical protein